jgi:hypothetical protein
MRFISSRMTRMARSGLAVFVLGMFLASEVRAGMPSPTLADVRRELSLSHLTRIRLETVSFFLLGLLVVALLIRAVWNGLRTDFPRLPRLSIGKAMGLVTLWGLLFVLVLTMISGARELMTPGAWEKKGSTYQLVEDGPSSIERQINERHDALDRLGKSLIDFAEKHEMANPSVDPMVSIPDSLWIVPASGGLRYVYKGGVARRGGNNFFAVPLAYEPDVFGADRLVLLNNGSVVWMPIDEIKRVESRENR